MPGIFGHFRYGNGNGRSVPQAPANGDLLLQPGTPNGDGLWLAIDGAIHKPEPSFSGAVGEEGSASYLARLYERKGIDFLVELSGSFSLALWDPKARRLLLAVDPFGTRSLYYACENGLLAFASRISRLRAYQEISSDIEPNALYCYLNHSYIPAPFTIYRQIRRLQPGHFLLWENGSFSVKSYWDLSYPEDKGLSEGTASELIREALESSIRVRLRDGVANRNLGAFLSGGTDSSTLVGLLSKLTGKRIKTFSVGFDEEPYNEIEYARIAANEFYSEAYEHFVRSYEAIEIVPLLATIYDEPFGNSSAIPTYFCLKMAREVGVDVMFAGDGGDELFGGNERYLTDKLFSLYGSAPRGIKTCVDPLVLRFPRIYPLSKIRSYVQKANQPNPDRFFAYQLYLRENAEEFFTDDLLALLDRDFPLRTAREYYQKMHHASPLNRLLYLDVKLAVGDNDLFKVNRTAESLGIRVSYPFLDQGVASIAGRVPAYLKVKGFKKRYIFKRAFQKLLPEEILKKKKHGFGLPTGAWLREDPGFKELAHALLLDSRSIQRGYFKSKALQDLLRKHETETSQYYGTFIWNFMMLELWHRNHLDRTATSGAKGEWAEVSR